MTRKEINQTEMLQSVDAFIDNKSEQLAAIPAIAECSVKLKGILTNIRDTRQVQDKDAKGATAKKQLLEDVIVKGILKIGAAIQAHATVANNVDLKLLSGFSPNMIKRLRDSNLADKARTISEAALPIAGELGAFFVTQEEIELLGSNALAYLAALPKRRNIISETKQSTVKISTKINEGIALLADTLDKLMLPFEAVNPDLYAEYLNNRMVIDTSAGHKKKNDGTSPDIPAPEK